MSIEDVKFVGEVVLKAIEEGLDFEIAARAFLRQLKEAGAEPEFDDSDVALVIGMLHDIFSSPGESIEKFFEVSRLSQEDIDNIFEEESPSNEE